MEFEIYTVHDETIGLYNRPIYMRNTAEALRMFEDVASDPNHPIGQHPEQYVLYKIGTWHEPSGTIMTEERQHIARGSDFASVQAQHQPQLVSPNAQP